MGRFLSSVCCAAALVAAAAAVAEAGASSEALWSRGLAALHRGDAERAVELFDLAVAEAPEDPGALFHRGLARRTLGDLEGARGDLEAVVSITGPDDPIGERARAELEQVRDVLEPERSRREGPGESRQEAASRLSLRAALGLEYDTNVLLAPEATSLRALYGIGDESDGRTILRARIAYSMLRTKDVEVVAAYDGAQSVHFSIDDSDVQTHRGAVSASWTRGSVSAGGLVSYAWNLVEEESFLGEAVLHPWLRWTQGSGRSLSLAYRASFNEFFDQPLDALLGGTLHSLSLVQSVDFGEKGHRLRGGYRFERRAVDSGAGAGLEYGGHSIAADVLWVLPWGLDGETTYVWAHQDYDDASAGRDDSEHRLRFALARRLSGWLAVRLAHEATFHDSNQASFRHERQLTSLVLEARY